MYFTFELQLVIWGSQFSVGIMWVEARYGISGLGVPERDLIRTGTGQSLVGEGVRSPRHDVAVHGARLGRNSQVGGEKRMQGQSFELVGRDRSGPLITRDKVGYGKAGLRVEQRMLGGQRLGQAQLGSLLGFSVVQRGNHLQFLCVHRRVLRRQPLLALVVFVARLKGAMSQMLPGFGQHLGEAGLRRYPACFGAHFG